MSDLMNTQETAERIGCPSSHALRARYRRNPSDLPAAIRIGSRLYWNREDVERWLDALKTEERARIDRDAEFRRRMDELGL